MSSLSIGVSAAGSTPYANNTKLQIDDSELHILIRAIMEELGYPITRSLGLCDGFVMAGMLAFFDDQIKKCNEIIKYIKEDLVFSDLSIMKIRLKSQNRQASSDEEKKMVATLDLFDEIALHQTHLLGSQLFNNRYLSKTATKQQIELEAGLFSTALPTTTTYDEFMTYFTSIQESVNRSEIPVSIKIEAGYSSPQSRTLFEAHVICICYNPLSKNWTLVDINQLPVRENYSSYLAENLQFISDALKIINKQFTIYHLSLYATMQNKDSLSQLSRKISVTLNSTVSAESTIGLSSFQNQALQNLKKEGLTATDLRNWHANSGYFGSDHVEALTYLILKCSLQPGKAIEKLCDLERHQVEALTRGLLREEVIGLQIFQILALEHYKEHGLTATHLRNWKGDYFSSAHLEALRCLLINHHLQPEVAITELNGAVLKNS